jgi:hypothetical protein
MNMFTSVDIQKIQSFAECIADVHFNVIAVSEKAFLY